MEGQNTQKPSGDGAPQAPAASVNSQVKTYPTSFLPSKSLVEYPRPEKAAMALWHIEVSHIVIFILLLVGLFYAMWKRPNLR